MRTDRGASSASVAQRELVGAVVVIFYPEQSIVVNLAAIVAECDAVVVVDNGCSAEIRAHLAAMPGIHLISLGENRGIAAGLNRGVEWVATLGYEWCLTFDQDSFPKPGFVIGLTRTRQAFQEAGVIAPCIEEAVPRAKGYKWMRKHPSIPLFYQRIGCSGADLTGVTTAVTSGSMIDLKLWKELKAFDESLFIDGVDTDYCLKVVRAGRRVVVSHGAVLVHRLGERENRRFLGQEFRPTHHAAFRHYFMARNRIALWSRHTLAAPHWALFEAVFAVFNTSRVLLFEGSKWMKVKAIMLGTWDGLMGRSGPCPPIRKASFDQQRRKV